MLGFSSCIVRAVGDVVVVIVTRYGGLPQQARRGLLRRLSLPWEVSLWGHHSRLLQPETHQNTRSYSSIHRWTVSHAGFVWCNVFLCIALYITSSSVSVSSLSLLLFVSDQPLLFSFLRRLNNNEFTVLEATGIFKKLPQLRKMWVRHVNRNKAHVAVRKSYSVCTEETMMVQITAMKADCFITSSSLTPASLALQ